MITFPIIGPQTVTQAPTASKSATVKEIKTKKFLRNLYTYPPKIIIKTDLVKPLPSAKQETRLKYRIDGRGRSSNPTGLVNFNIAKQKKNYKDRAFTSNFYSKGTAPIQRALRSIPVYTIVNGQQDIVLVSPMIPSLQSSNQINATIDNFVGRAQGSTVNSNLKLGLFFFEKKDALMYLESIAETDPLDVDQIGLSVHCLGLDCAYDIIKQHHPTIDFRLVPNLREVETLLGQKNVANEHFLFDYQQHQLSSKIRQVALLPQLGNISLNTLSPFFSAVQNNEYYKGVPIYLIQYKNPPRTTKNISSLKFQQMFLNSVQLPLLCVDTFLALIYDPIEYMLGLEQRPIMKGNSADVSTSSNVTNYIFFDCDQAIAFFNLHRDRVTRFAGNRRVSSAPQLIRRGQIYTTNLEEFLERWEVSLVKETLLEKKAKMPVELNTPFNVKETIFVVSNYMSTTNSIPPVEPWQVQFKDYLVLKYKRFQSAFNLFTRA
uniref:hypothetical chloroplast RF80 n=1 Tax=Ochrosphaera neapolitana TaxID=35137 RepID=UPI00286C3DB1|nr:hypothetical chloroplast RF80 [Ochrosphaera neapolitana]WKK50144.1 hypothetical chloroplast RF80 [Ochrosphaera neapolitana]